MATVNLAVSASTDDARNLVPDSTFSAVVVTQHIGKFNTVDIYYNGFRWTGASIPQAATINSATITLYAAGVNGGTTAKSIWYGEAADNAATFSNTTANKPEGRAHTTASTAKDFATANWGTVGYNSGDTIDVTSIVQEIINRAGWASGNAIVIVATDNGSANTSYIGHSTYDRAIDRGAKLDVTYTVSTPTATKTNKIYMIMGN